MSSVRRQALIPSPVAVVWALVGNPRRHPEWWPRVIEVRGERFYAGDSYAQVTRPLVGRVETQLTIEALEDLSELRMRCLNTGMFSRWLLTPAQDGTFVDAEFGMEAEGLSNRAFDAVAGRVFFRRWLDESLESLGRKAAAATPPA